MTKEESIKIVNFMTSGAGVLVLYMYKSFSENALFLYKSSPLLPGIDKYQLRINIVMMSK